MTGHPHRVLLVLLTSAALLHLSNPVSTHEDRRRPPGDGSEERVSVQREEEEQELFKDVDPRRLAAVLLEALNRSQVERRMEGGGVSDVEEEVKAERRELRKEEEYQERAERHRDGRPESELLMASQARGREEEEEERRKALEEEEKLTERVTSRTSSQAVQTRPEQNPNTSAGPAGHGAAPQAGPANPQEEEEQLSPEELRSLETMMKEFPRLSVKREDGGEQERRGSRGSRFNDVNPSFKGSDLAWSKKKLKWQEETQKALHLPTFTGGNHVERPHPQEAPAQPPQPPQPPADQEAGGGDDPEEEQALSPEEEEARAKEEQEELMRQAAEARKAKMEEEKLADMASDMLLRYMAKQRPGAAEDKRSEEEQELPQENDMDPQTIDKLIEISNKLHLPADDVVDIVTDVEKKKKKDAPGEAAALWQRPPSLAPLSASSFNQNRLPVSRHPPPAADLLRTWIQEKKKKLKSEGVLRNRSRPRLAGSGLWPGPRPLLVQPDRRLQSPRPVWTRYPFYTYPSTPDYYPVYPPPARRPRPRYYLPRPALLLHNFMDGSFGPAPDARHHSWVPPRLRKPPTGLRSRYPVSETPPSSPARQRPPGDPAAGPSGTRSSDEDLEKVIQLVLLERVQRMD